MELRDQVSVRGVNLDAIEAGVPHALGRARKGCDGTLDASKRHRLRNDGGRGDLIDRMGDRRRCDRRFSANVRTRVATTVAELDGRLRTGLVDGLGQACEAGEET